jgi:RNA-directed DNA polymerase
VRFPRATHLVITGSSKELLQMEVKPLVERFLSIRGLELSPEKTRMTHIAEGFDFLGQNVRSFNGKIIVTPAKRNIQAFKAKVKEIFAENKTAKQENLIGVLNPVVRGWANYHRAACASQTFASIDSWLWLKTWQWAKRRHPNKSADWIKAKYFVSMGSRDWVFSVKLNDSDGKRKRVTLAKASDTPIRRHAKIKGDANPFDPQWEPYFEDRLGLKMQGDMKGKAKLLRLWWSQNKRCKLCDQLITKETGWNIHHRIPKCEGGADNYANLALLHPNCHRQHHAAGLTLESRPR